MNQTYITATDIKLANMGLKRIRPETPEEKARMAKLVKRGDDAFDRIVTRIFNGIME